MQEAPDGDSLISWYQVIASGILGWLLRGLLDQHQSVRSRINEKRAEELIQLDSPIQVSKRRSAIFTSWIRDWTEDHVQSRPVRYFNSSDHSQDITNLVHAGIMTDDEADLLDRVYEFLNCISEYDDSKVLRIDNSNRDELLFVSISATEIWHRAEVRLNRRLGISRYRGIAALPSLVISSTIWAFSDIKRAINANWVRFLFRLAQKRFSPQRKLYLTSRSLRKGIERLLDTMEDRISSTDNPYLKDFVSPGDGAQSDD